MDHFEFRKTNTGSEASMTNIMYEGAIGHTNDCTDSNAQLLSRPAAGRSKEYAKVNKKTNKNVDREDSVNRPPQPLPRGITKQSAAPNMYESITGMPQKSRTNTNGFTAAVPSVKYTSSTLSTNSNFPLPPSDLENAGISGYMTNESLDTSISLPSPSNSFVDSPSNTMYEKDMAKIWADGQYNKPRPSIPNLFIKEAYLSSDDIHNPNVDSLKYPCTSDDSESMKSAKSHLLVGAHKQSLDGSRDNLLPTDYYDSPRPSLANAFAANNNSGYLDCNTPML